MRARPPASPDPSCGRPRQLPTQTCACAGAPCAGPAAWRPDLAAAAPRPPLAGLQVLLLSGAEISMVADLLPRQWGPYLRNAPAEQLKPFGSPLARPGKGMYY